MTFPIGATTRTSHRSASETMYDAVVVGGGVTGSIIANQLSRAGQRVLVVEAGIGEDHSLEGYEAYLDNFYTAVTKDNQSPYPRNANAPMPRSTDTKRIRPGEPDTSGYLVQNGPFASDTTYTRVLGGTTMHWEAKTPRMLPEDFRMHSDFGVGRDWPLSYDDLCGPGRHRTGHLPLARRTLYLMSYEPLDHCVPGARFERALSPS